MQHPSAPRRRGRLTALILTLCALCLVLLSRKNGLTLPRIRPISLPDRLSAALVTGELPAAGADAAPREQLERSAALFAPPAPQEPPAPADRPEEAMEEEAPAQPEAEFPLPLSGILEAPEEPEPLEEIVTPDLVDYSGIAPQSLELTNSTDGISLNLGDYLTRPLALTLASEAPQILIMHTHGSEAYTMADGDDYTPTDTARTTDPNYNMIRVGEEMKAVFEEMGLQVIHDTTLYDYPGYTGAYSRSLEGIRQYLEQYPSISVVLDVHRDALIGADGTAYKLTDTVDEETAAQVMLVVGSNDAGLEHPDWQENLTLAAHIQAALLALHPGLPRALNLRSQRFNQHMTLGSLLVEVGTSGNTLQEALAGARLFARAAGSVYLACGKS